MAVALDSNVVVGFLDSDDAFHDAADRRIREFLADGQNLYASVLTYAEVLTGAKRGHHGEDIVRGFFDKLISWVMPVDRLVGDRAAELRGQHRSLKMPDALILAGADVDQHVELILCSDDVADGIKGALRCEVEPLTPTA